MGIEKRIYILSCGSFLDAASCECVNEKGNSLLHSIAPGRRMGFCLPLLCGRGWFWFWYLRFYCYL